MKTSQFATRSKPTLIKPTVEHYTKLGSCTSQVVVGKERIQSHQIILTYNNYYCPFLKIYYMHVPSQLILTILQGSRYSYFGGKESEALGLSIYPNTKLVRSKAQI